MGGHKLVPHVTCIKFPFFLKSNTWELSQRVKRCHFALGFEPTGGTFPCKTLLSTPHPLPLFGHDMQVLAIAQDNLHSI